MSILVVTNSADSGRVIIETLQSLFVSMKRVNNYQEALVQIEKAPDKLDLIILDIGMNFDDGLDLLMTLQESNAAKEAGILAFSSGDQLEPGQVSEAIRFGANQFVATPFDEKELLRRVKQELRIPAQCS